MLDSKDREELHAIAGAMGVRAATRMKKADLIDAILGAANGGGAERCRSVHDRDAATSRSASGRAAPPKPTIPSSELAAEEDAIAAGGRGRRVRVDARPRRAATRPRGNGGADHRPAAPHPMRNRRRWTEAATATATATATPTAKTADRARGRAQSYGEGNRRRRRRARPRPPTGRRAPRARVPGRADRRRGPARPARRGLRLPARDRLPPGRQGRLRLGFAGAAVRAAQGRLRQGSTRPPASNEKYPALLRVDEINGMTPDEARERPRFEDLTPLFPDSRLRLELAEDPPTSPAGSSI